MSVALHIYEQLTDAGKDKTRAKVIANAFEQPEECHLHLKEVTAQGYVRESELRLLKETRKVDEKLQKEIENVRLEIREAEKRLQHEIGQIRLEVKPLEIRLAETKAELVHWVVTVGLLQTTLIFGELLKIAHLI